MPDFFRWPNRHEDEFLSPAQRARLDGDESLAEKLEAEAHAALATRLGWEQVASENRAAMIVKPLDFESADLPQVHAEHDEPAVKM